MPASRVAFYSFAWNAYKSNILLTLNVQNSWLLIQQLRALSLAFSIGKIREIRGKERYACKISRGHRNPFEYLHLNGKHAELGEGQKWMNVGSRGSDWAIFISSLSFFINSALYYCNKSCHCWNKASSFVQCWIAGIMSCFGFVCLLCRL